ncbi:MULTISPECIES: ABC transporter permease [Enterococcus]|uniref:ABC transporter permease n=1 Tax=Enterococcus alishanensis TaxID=1303817 RepID=A0ABS6T9G5_9ENTE|nr:ABC transporter permease [Enterococcus alishanensis]MBV7389535.1 ABC transporter permease [Enterococcus alishanensis]
MSKMGIIIKDVYKKNVKSTAFVIMILAPFLLMGIFYLAQHFFGNTNDINEIGIISNQPAVAEQLKSQSSEDFNFKVMDSKKQAQNQLENEKIDAYFVIDTKDDDTVQSTLYSTSSLGTTTEGALTQITNQLQLGLRAGQLNINNQQVAHIIEPGQFQAKRVNFEDGKMKVDEADTGAQYWISFATTIIMFIFIMSYSSIIAQEIASEKGTRIMEVLLSSMKAKTHYYGKLIGVLLVALTQLIIYGVAIVVGYQQFKNTDFIAGIANNVTFKHLFGVNTIIMLAFMIFGILLYAVLSALCGSLVNKPEDTAKAIQPVMYLSLIGYMLNIIMGAANPTNIIVKVTAYIPFLSSYSMPLRLSTDTVSLSGAVISLVVLIVFTILLNLFSAQLYKSNVLVYSEGGMVSALRQSFSIMRNDREK